MRKVNENPALPGITDQALVSLLIPLLREYGFRLNRMVPADGSEPGVGIVKLDDCLPPDDNTNLNASTSKHGLLPKLSGNHKDLLNGDGDWIRMNSFIPGGW